MNDETRVFSDLLRGKRIGLVACPATKTTLTDTLQRAQAMVAHIDANAIGPGAYELERYDALILHVGDVALDSDWFRPEILETNSRPLVLAGQASAIFSRMSLQEHADDTIFEPFVESETIFRLARLAAGMLVGWHAVTRLAKPCVVVADDDGDILVYLKNIFRNFDLDVHFVSDGRAALTAARQFLPDLLLLDVLMPGMNGIEVLRRLRDDPGTSALTTVLLTASADPEHVEDGATLGAAAYILKPFGHLDLIRKLKPFLEIGASRQGSDHRAVHG